MASAGDNRRSSAKAEETTTSTTNQVSWVPEAEDSPWHADSQLPASDALSGLPEEVEPEPMEDADLDPADLVADEDEASPDEMDPDGDVDLDKLKGRRRSKTIARKQMLRERRRMLAQGTAPEILDYERPGSRSECREDKRPCLYVSCRYHLYLDVNPVTGSIKLNFPDKEVWELEETCALDVAERGGITLEEVGAIMNLTRERIRQVEVSGLDKLKGGEADLETFLEGRELPVGPPGLPVVED